MKMKNVWTFFGIYFNVNIREVWMDVIMKIHNLIYIETLITLSYHLLFPLKHNPEIRNCLSKKYNWLMIKILKFINTFNSSIPL